MFEKDPDFDRFSTGLTHMSVCALKTLTRKEVVAYANLKHPSGTQFGWTISEEPTFRTGHPNPCVCNDDPERLHYLMIC